MSKFANYRVVAAWFEDADVTLRVDHELLTPELATQINTFWSGDDSRLAEENEDVVRAVIRLFGVCAIHFLMSDEGGMGFQTDTDPHWTKEVLKAQHEGWPAFEALGILITSASVSSVGYGDVSLELLP